jgi:hypothetical protein
MARRRKEDASISLVPMLSIQKCTIGVLVVIICAQTLVSLGKTADQYLEIAGAAKDKQAVYVECAKDGVIIHPEGTKVAKDKLQDKGPSAYHDLLDRLGASGGKKYLVLLVRPEGVESYERCFKLAYFDRKLDVGKEALLSGGQLVLTRDGKALVRERKAGH